MTRDELPAAGRARVILVGVLPPPVYGAALVNAAVGEVMTRMDVAVTLLDVSPRSLGRGLIERYLRAPRVLGALARFAWLCVSRRVDVLYLGISGSIGQLYDLAFVTVARASGRAVFLHHHSFAYIDRHRWYSRCLFQAAGKHAVHVVLCSRMKAGLQATYRRAFSAIQLSNAAWTPVPGAGVARTHLARVGYFGNISAEKGIWEFLEIARKPALSDLDFVIGGAFQDADVESRFAREVRSLSNVRYVGPRFDAEKDRFYREIDLLVFPSRYSHEAEPLTVLEALAHGVPVIATPRGCLESLVPSAVGKLCEEREFVEMAASAIEGWRRSPAAFEALSVMASREFQVAHQWAQDSVQELIRALQS